MSSREIKFRAWDHKWKRMIYGADVVVYGDGTFMADCRGEDGGDVIVTITEKQADLSQYTGLKDRNGREIYEGDILRILYTDWPSPSPDETDLEKYKRDISRVGVVFWNPVSFDVRFGTNRYGEDDIGGMEPGAHGEREVIGNIYENSELKKIAGDFAHD